MMRTKDHRTVGRKDRKRRDDRKFGTHRRVDNNLRLAMGNSSAEAVTPAQQAPVNPLASAVSSQRAPSVPIFNIWRHTPGELKAIWGVKSGMNIDDFIMMSIGYDPIECDYVIQGLLHGFRLGLNPEGPFPPQRLWAESHNSPEASVRITNYLLSEREEGRIFGPLPNAPSGNNYANTVVYPMNEVPKADGGYRTVSNLSFKSPLDSVNGFIPKSERTTEYPSFTDVASSMVAIGLMVVIFSLFDVKNAYRNLRISCFDWQFGIIAWRDLVTGAKQFWLDTSLVFGGASGCRIYNRVGTLLAYILRKHGFTPGEIAQALIVYLDDHLLMTNGFAASRAVLNRMLAIMEHLRVPVKTAKTIVAAVEVKFLGYWWMPRKDLVALDPARWVRVEGQLRILLDMLVTGMANAQDIRCVTGVLVWAARVIPSGSVFTRGLHQVLRLYGATSLPASQARRVLIRDEVRIQTAVDDLTWWLELCVRHRLGTGRPIGISISGIVNPKSWVESECSLVFHCDASGKGLGGFMNSLGGTKWVFAELPPGLTLSWSKTPLKPQIGPVVIQESISSGYCEAAGLYLSLLTFLPIWSQQHPDRIPGAGVWAWSDSKVVVDMWESKRACDTMLPYLRAFAHMEAYYNITLIVSHIDGVSNTTADSISRQNWSRFRELQPNADRFSLPLPLVPTLFL